MTAESDIKNTFEKRKARNSPRKQRISKAPEERKQEIIETAFELLSKNGYENVNIQDITDKMNVSPGLCYRYFKSKTKLFAAVSEFYAMKLLEELQAPISQNLSAVQKLNIVIKRIYDFTQKHYAFEVKYQEAVELRALYLDTVASQWAARLLPIIQQGKEEETFHCTDIQLTAQFLAFGLIHAFHNKVYFEKYPKHAAAFLEFSYEMFSRSLNIPSILLKKF